MFPLSYLCSDVFFLVAEVSEVHKEESMSLMALFARVPTCANPADAPSRGEVAHLDGVVRLPDDVVCDCASRLMTAMLERAKAPVLEKGGKRTAS